MAEAQIEEVVNVSKAKLFQAVTSYDEYPKFVEGCKSVKVDRSVAGKTRVTYSISMMKEISYTLEHVEDLEKGVISWTLVQSDFLKKNNGRWDITSAGDDQARVKYSIDIDFKFPVPGFVLNKLVKGSLPSMLKSFEKRAKTL